MGDFLRTESIVLGLGGSLNHALDDSESNGELVIVLLGTGHFEDAAVPKSLAVKLNPDPEPAQRALKFPLRDY